MVFLSHELHLQFIDITTLYNQISLKNVLLENL